MANFQIATAIILCFTTISCVSGDCDTSCTCEETAEDVKVTCKGHSIDTVPQDLPRNTTKMYLSGTGISKIYKGDFSRYSNLTELFFRDTASEACELEYLEPGVFHGLRNLIALGMIGCGRLTSVLPGVFGTFQSLQILHIYRSGLVTVPDFSELHTLNPKVDGFMDEIDLHNNRIEKIGTNAFSGVKVYTLKLEQNKITTIESKAFKDAFIVRLTLNRNTQLTTISPDAFDGADITETLDLSDSKITSLPTIGLKKITHLVLKNTPSLKHFPSVLQLPNIKEAELYYPHHCCAFNNPEKQDPVAWKLKQAQEKLNRDCSTTTPTIPAPKRIPLSDFGKRLTTTIPFDFRQTHGNQRMRRNSRIQEVPTFAEPLIDPFNGSHGDVFVPLFAISPSGFGNFSGKGEDPGRQFIDGGFHDPVDVNRIQNSSCGQIYVPHRNITCTPEPDAFNPCEDVMGYVWLRVTIWFVLLAALLGNSIVLFVLITSRSKFGVPKFLMCNLAFADFVMGVYLILIASIDVHTLGEYFNYAVQWQNDGGCQVAGFLSVFSSEFSVFTLTILTLERWYAISHAIHLNKRLKFRHSVLLMCFGFIFAVSLAVLPLVGVSGYGNVSICLPMQAKNSLDVGYVVSLLVMNGLMFLAICFCYLNMYWKVKGNANSARNNDATIAKRMAILVFTNFACWAPIAFFGLTASAGVPLIDITNSKILLVFFYPLNSCANPFLYAILTKQFRKDVFILLGKYGICVEKANRYRGTFTSRSMSHSRGHKEMMLHGVHKRTESLFSRLSNIPDSNNGSRGSVSSTPKVHPCRQRSQKDTFFEKSLSERQEEFGRRRNNTANEDPKADVWKSEEQDHEHPPYVRSVSDYIGYNGKKENSNRYFTRTRMSTETTSTYISSGTDSAMEVLSDAASHMNEDVWQIRDSVDAATDGPLVDVGDESYKGRPFTCLIYPQDDEIRISHKNCYTASDGIDLEDDENFQRFLRDDIINSVNFRRDSSNRSPQKSVNNSNYSNRYRFARSPSLSSLEENAETCLLQRESQRRASTSSYGNEIELPYIEGSLKTDRSKESGFHSSISVHGEISV